MDAGKRSLETIFNKGRIIEVPFFQRSYVWEEENWERFLLDLQIVSKGYNDYFMGSIILKAQQVSSGEKIGDRRILVDGQQRLTTTILFFKAWSEINESPEIMNTFYNRSKELILLHNHNDIKTFESILKGEMEILDQNEKSSNLFCAYEFFKTKKNELKEIDINNILNRVFFVGIDLTAEEDEQQIFDTINSLGVSLTTAELLKNELYQRKDEALYNSTWRQMFEGDSDSLEYWGLQVTAGRLYRTNIDLFLQSYLLIRTEAKENYMSVENLYQNFKDHIKQVGGNSKLLIKELMEYAEIYRENINPLILNEDINRDSYQERLNLIIFGLNITTVVPYVLYILRVVTSEEEKKLIFKFLETYIVRRVICQESSKNYNKLFTTLIRNKTTTLKELRSKLQNAEYESQQTYSDEILSQSFHSKKISNQQAKLVLYLIEKSQRTSKDSTSLLPFNDYTLEHLMPKKWRNHWGKPEAFDDIHRDRALLTLGNLTILTASLNSSIRDADWETKKAGNSRKKGLKEYSKGIKILDPYLESQEWNETTISIRAEELYKKALFLWPSK